MKFKDVLFKLSPSDFKYLWEDCKHCFWRKVHLGERQPTIFPSIFNKMSGQLQKSVLMTKTQDLCSELPHGDFVLQEGFLKSQPLPSGKSYISGRFDLLTKLEDGTHAVIDLKMVDPNETDLSKFDRQLHAYKYALEHPLDKDPIIVSRMGLLVLEPVDVKPHDGAVYYKAKPTWREFSIDMGKFFTLINKMESVLDGPEPKHQAECQYCAYRY